MHELTSQYDTPQPYQTMMIKSEEVVEEGRGPKVQGLKGPSVPRTPVFVVALVCQQSPTQ